MAPIPVILYCESLLDTILDEYEYTIRDIGEVVTDFDK